MPSERAANPANDGGIGVYLRIRPSSKPSGYFDRDDVDENRLIFHVPKAEDLIVNNSRTRYGFQFNGILDGESTQEDVFRSVGVPAVRNALEGFNSTVFAYGQTGSGKTFTITGGPERYVDRGIIPRAISMLFAEFKRRPDVSYTCYVSYLELYNEGGYDLLVEDHDDTSRLEDLQRVTMMEDEDGNYHFKNLSVHPVSSEEEALNFLFVGDTNRAIGETDMNKASSRSHCIFTLAIEGRKVGSDSVTRSKLNLVDLAGSERVHRTSSSGQTLREAQYINTSLFYLEMVIVALHEKEKKGKERTHVPYRNSMMTSVLRDSLGGNCKTLMVATISPESNQTDESISTCNFAQRVALVKNSAQINEELEPELIIRRLKAEISRLREEVKFLKGENGEEDSMTQDQHDQLAEAIERYVEEKDDTVELNIGSMTLTKIRSSFALLKKFAVETRRGGTGLPQDEGERNHGTSTTELEKQILSLKKKLQQRDHEIAILVNMVKQKKGYEGRKPITDITEEKSSIDDEHGDFKSEEKYDGAIDHSGVNKNTITPRQQRQKVCGVPICLENEVLEDPAKAFAWFQEHYPGLAPIEENKLLLKDKIDEAKSTGELVQKSRNSINYHKATIEQLRRERAMEGIGSFRSQHGDETKSIEPSPEEMEHRNAIEEQKTIYKDGFHTLRELKSTIEHIQQYLTKSRTKMQSDFDVWYREMCGEPQETVSAYVRTSSEGKSAGPAASRRMGNESRSLSPDSVGCHSGPATGSHALVTRSVREGQRNVPPEPKPPPGIRLTGNKEADDDIIAFYKAKEALLARQASSSMRPP